MFRFFEAIRAAAIVNLVFNGICLWLVTGQHCTQEAGESLHLDLVGLEELVTGRLGNSNITEWYHRVLPIGAGHTRVETLISSIS